MNIFVINPGSTSTKLALFKDETRAWEHVIHHHSSELAAFEHPNQQLDYRINAVRRALADNGISLAFDAIIARGGLLQPTEGGVYPITELIKHDLINARQEHACNLGALIADDLAQDAGCPSFIADPEVVDELMPCARLTGIPELERKSIFHALNSKAVSRKYARSIGCKYEDLDIIVIHMGGGISVSAHHHGRVIDTNNALNGDGPFTPERAGTIPADQLAELCFSGRYSLREIKNMLNGKGGLAAYLGVNDMKETAERAQAGEEPYRHVVEAMIYTIAKEVGARYVALHGHVDTIIITGGIAHSRYCVDKLSSWIDYLAPITVIPGEDEMGALAANARGALRGELPLKQYAPRHPIPVLNETQI